MRFRTFVGILTALAVVVTVAYLSQLNIDLLTRPFFWRTAATVPLYVVLLAVFLLGFLPSVGVLLVQTLQRDLAQRRSRRLSREARSLRHTFRRAVDLETDGQWSKAAAEYEAVLAGRPEDFSALLRYGEVLRRAGRAGEALEVHRKASVLYPQSLAVLYQMAEDYEALGDESVAGQIRDRVLRDFSGVGLPILRRRRSAALAARDWREAARLQERIEALLTEGRDDEGLEREREVRMGLDYQRGVEHLRADRPDEARRAFSAILEREPRFIPAAIMLGEAELLDDRAEQAVDSWRQGFLRTGSPVFLQRIEDHFIEREEPMEAIETLHRVIGEVDNDLLPRFFLGRLYYRLEMHQEALRSLGDLRQRIQASPTYHLLLARIHERRGEMAKAVQSLSACVGEAGIATAEYVCRTCRAKYSDWMDRCDACGSWNSVEMDFQEEKIDPRELGVQAAPIWAIYGDAEAFRGGEGSEGG